MTKYAIKNIKNTFAPRCNNEYLSAADIFLGLNYGFLSEATLSPDAKAKLKEYLAYKYPKGAVK